MFKLGSFENELIESLEKNLTSKKADEIPKKILKAATYINEVISIFKKANMQDEANDLVNVLEKISNKIKNKL